MKFIVFEGLDGAGKSTLIEALKSEILKSQAEVVVTREPGGTNLGTQIRQMLLTTAGEAPVTRAELLLYEADRAQHVEKVIAPCLAAGKWVISDRYYASTVAFQVGGRNLNLDDIEWLNRYATNGLEPDLWVLLDLTTDEAKKRMQGRELDRFEGENQEFHERVRQTYLKMSRAHQDRWFVLNAEKSPEQLKAELLAHIRSLNWL